MLKIRLARVGKKKQPTYRLVAADERRARDGKFHEILGQYYPLADPSQYKFDEDRVLTLLNQGAQPTETVRKLLELSGVWEKYLSSRKPVGRKRIERKHAR